jgi:hypothetical protein
VRPDGVSNARSSSRVHGPWHPSPAQAFGLVAAGSTVGQYGTPADYGGLATAVTVAPVLSPRRSPGPWGRGCLCPFPRAAVRSFQTPFVTPPARTVWPNAPHTSRSSAGNTDRSPARRSLWFRQSPSLPPRRSVHSGTEEDNRTPFGWVLTNAALQRAVRNAAFCSNPHPEASPSGSQPRRIVRQRQPDNNPVELTADAAIAWGFLRHPHAMA